MRRGIQRMAHLALNGGSPVRTKEFPGWPVFDDSEIRNLEEVVRSGKWFAPGGTKVKEFEARFAEFQNAKYGIAVCNGTIALEMALLTLGVGAGDEVIIPAYTFVATATAVLRCNAVPIPVDIHPDTYLIDPDAVEKAITDKTKAIMPVHLSGLPVDMDRINATAKKHNLGVVEDAAQAWGAGWKGKGVGAWGDLGGFSFQMSKNLTAGEGGIVLTDDEGLADCCRAFADCGRIPGESRHDCGLLGINARLTEFQGAVLHAQLDRYPDLLATREASGKALTAALEEQGLLTPIRRPEEATGHAYHFLMLKYDASKFDGLPKTRFLEALNAEGITNVHGGYGKTVYEHPVLTEKKLGNHGCPLACPYYGREVDYTQMHCPVAEKAVREEAIWVKQNALLAGPEEMSDIVEAVGKIHEHRGELTT
jgi:dTDP-4-amino-4,6-dideoxygalactose transaminase